MAPDSFADLAAIVERHAAGERLDASEVRAAIGDRPARTESAMYRVGDTAVIPIRGVIARYADQVNGVCSDTGRSADSIQADIKAASADLMVKRIALRIDSPGGTVAGTAETAAAIRASGKPVHAFVDGLAASAAYWLASAADTITASAPTAQVGSIGVIMAHVDETAANEKRGYKVHVIRSVALKAPGTEGESLSAEQLDSMQRRITQLHAAFTDAVAGHRGMDAAAIAQVSTGEVWAAAQAQAMGLIDGVQGWDAWLAGLATITTSGGSRNSTKATAMNIEDLSAITAKHPAKAADIVALAKDGKTADQIEAHLADLAKAEEAAALKTACDTAQAALKSEQDAHAVTKAELEKLKATAAHAQPRDPGAGAGEIRRGSMSLAQKSAFISAHGTDAFYALPL